MQWKRQKTGKAEGPEAQRPEGVYVHRQGSAFRNEWPDVCHGAVVSQAEQEKTV